MGNNPVSTNFKGVSIDAPVDVVPVKYASFDDIEEELETMTSDELCAYAAYTFEAMLNKYKASETLVDEIMRLFELAATNDCRVKFGYQNN